MQTAFWVLNKSAFPFVDVEQDFGLNSLDIFVERYIMISLIDNYRQGQGIKTFWF